MKTWLLQVSTPLQVDSLVSLISLVVVIALLVLGITALLLLCYALFPGLSRRTRRNIELRPIRSFFVGLVNFVFLTFIVAALGSAGSGVGVFAAVLAVIGFSFIALGLSAFALLVGQRLRPGDSNPVRQLIYGAIILELASLVPLVGWFAIPAFGGLTGFGALIITLVSRSPSPTTNEIPLVPDSNIFSTKGGGK